MDRRFRFVLGLAIAGSLSCSHSGTATPAPAPAPAHAAGAGRGAAAAPPAATPPPAQGVGVATGAPPAGGPPGGGRGPGGPPGGGRVQLTPEQRAARRDSLSAMRGGVVTEVMATIAGKEGDKASTVFKSLQFFQDSTAGAVVKLMDANFGKALSVGCTFCHVAGNYADDTKGAKKTTRLMIEMVNYINGTELAKIGGARPPRINCVTCHRGNQTPGSALLP